MRTAVAVAILWQLECAECHEYIENPRNGAYDYGEASLPASVVCESCGVRNRVPARLRAIVSTWSR